MAPVAPSALAMPYPLPDVPATAQEAVQLTQQAADMDQPQAPPNSLGSTTSGAGETADDEDEDEAADDGNTPPILSTEMLLLLKKAIEKEQSTMQTIKDDIAQLRIELAKARNDLREKELKKSQTGAPDLITLALEFPNRKKTQKALEEGIPTESDKEENGKSIGSTGAGPADESEGSLKYVSFDLKPIPVIYAEEDARADLAHAVQNVLEDQDAEAAILTGEIVNEARSIGHPIAERISNIQKKIDVLSAKQEFFDIDADLAQAELESKKALYATEGG